MISFFGRFFPDGDRDQDIGCLRELILVNQLESNVETHCNECKSNCAQFYCYGFYSLNRIYTMNVRVCLHGRFIKKHFVQI